MTNHQRQTRAAATLPDRTALTSRLDDPNPARQALGDSVRALQSAVRGALVTDAQAAHLAEQIANLAHELSVVGNDDELGDVNLSPGLKNGSQAFSPVFEVLDVVDGRVHGTVRFPRSCLGAQGAVHGGALAMFADDVLGRLANTLPGSLARTAYLHVEYRDLALVGEQLHFHASVEEQVGRKNVLALNLCRADESIAEVRGLWVTGRRASASQ